MSIKHLLLRAVAVTAVMVASSQAAWEAPQDAQERYKELSGWSGTVGTHKDPSWQMLGTTWGGEADGVSMSVNGAEWGSTSTELKVGDKIQFKIDMYKPLWGTHTFDVVGFWVNDNMLTTYSDEAALTESNKWEFNDGSGYKDYWVYDYYSRHGILTGNTLGEEALENWDKYYANEHKFFYTEEITVTEDFNVQATVLCSSDILQELKKNNNGNTHYPEMPSDDEISSVLSKFKRTGDRIGSGQGETENYKFTVTTKSVPEPATLSFLGFSLLGLAFFRKRNRK